MRILFLGDIVGKKGREVIRDSLAMLKDKYKPDFVIANAENSAHGKGITSRIYNELISYGVNAITMGNHTYSKKEIKETILKHDNLIVPFNIKDKIGNGYKIYDVNGIKLCVINLLGEALMGDYMTSLFESYKMIIKEVKADAYFIDLHAESTAEKRLFVEYFKDNLTAVVGTHTHIQTADECILYNKVAFISDVGMCGPYNSIIGREINESIKKNVYHENTRYEISENDPILCGVVIDIDDKYKSTNIERIQIRPKEN